MADEDVAREAKARQVTRATVSMEHAANIDKPVIFAVGNAPTALISLYELMQKSDWRPAFIIGVPVGFVNVEAAKELILKTDVPHIVNRGRKGGSNRKRTVISDPAGIKERRRRIWCEVRIYNRQLCCRCCKGCGIYASDGKNKKLYND